MMAPEDAFRLLADGLGKAGTPQAFDHLVERISTILDGEHVLIGKLLSDSASIRTVAFWSKGAFQPTSVYALTGTPCEHVLDGEVCEFADGVRQRFPDDTMLEELGVESYVGIPLRAPQGHLVGLLAVLSSRPLELAAYAPEVLRIAAAQAGAEMARRAEEEKRRSSDYRIQQLIYWDSVTGLPNRRYFMERLEEACEQARLRDNCLGLLYLDLQRFRQINDTQGHELGDLILAEIAGRFGAQTEPGEFVARLGGDEFMVLLTDTRPAAMAHAIERYRNSLTAPIQLSERSFSISASVGAALFPRDADTAQSLFQHASIALNHAKRDSSRTRFFTATMADELHQYELLQLRFSEALAKGKLSLAFQPQFSLKTGKLTGAEALCRWHDEILGHVSPGTFIPLAEEQGLICALGEWVLEAACQQLMAWERQGKPFPGRLCVNVSAQQMDDPRLAEHIQRIAMRVPPGKLGLELTESGLMRNPEQTVRITRALCKAGFSMAIDDFGTGYSSLSYLKRFAADTLKIDMSFVQDMLKSSHDHAIVATIIAMAQTLGMLTVAEGVEAAEQAEALRALGCTGVQGFHFGRPVDGATFAELWL
ncbi:sensor domain-containing phosphodiesterase [Halomonas sp. MCCC 1A17488]|uniref:Sensor domain-containing phosphodiesterase n=1 Tax=Billgrantia sulfidoxydans TaxID=2733484 RepID=A0ABX7W183_9GAMM|nr:MULTISPECIES: sensor domain-containing phosphodiesterase [Halomonas]MCE8016279.1 sensor domain-containing phosphodiesterase [Halomonas sp. MCCC 1A17488]MCG3239612.1 sensor domain-containing phosphodiesterase [Halomonas sp. MCCC 1A17488]QPP50474.1 sensor domain-containing phosphodiesterase [Halomonas sp. SS10-MC5]QTP54091.1 sensor domain-containing phosphodiesterase [Halomonas sulfidoxydans]